VSWIALFWLAVGLAMDATAVAAARGLAAGRSGVRVGDVARVAVLFGGFQAGMPALGWLLGARVGSVLAAWDHWVAFVVLVGLGVKMMWESRGAGEPAAETGRAAFGWRTLLVLAVATSIDAFAAGFTLSLLDAPLVRSLVVIGVVTALLSAAGVYAGRRFGALLGKRLDLAGGVALVAIGVQTLVSHLRR
jgi:putative Mn2+ efflux pump MntP